MRRIVFGVAAVALALAPVGCQCGDKDKPRLIDRIFHRDTEESPSRSGGSQCDRKVGCDAAPVSYTPGPWTIGMTGTPRLIAPEQPGEGGSPSELPLPRINPPGGGVPATPREANPNEVSRPGTRLAN